MRKMPKTYEKTRFFAEKLRNLYFHNGLDTFPQKSLVFHTFSAFSAFLDQLGAGVRPWSVAPRKPKNAENAENV